MVRWNKNSLREVERELKRSIGKVEIPVQMVDQDVESTDDDCRRILSHLGEHCKQSSSYVTVQEMASVLDLSEDDTSIAYDKLEKAGWITLAQAMSRSKSAYITRDGRIAADEIRKLAERQRRTNPEQSPSGFSPKLVAVVSNTLDRMLDEREIDLPTFLRAYGLEDAYDQDGAPVGDPDVYLDGLPHEGLNKLIEAMIQEHSNPIYPVKKSGLRISSLGQLPKRLRDEGFDIQGDRIVKITSEARPFVPEIEEQPVSTIDIFISHNSKDKDLAEAFAELFRAALNIPPNKIRATSIYGHKLAAGADIDQLREETIGANLMVGIITDMSIESAYVLFELGARWGTKKALFPVLGAGATTSMLRGPLSRMNALRCDSEEDLHQIITNAATILQQYKLNEPQAYVKNIKNVVTVNNKLMEGRQENPQ